MSDTEPQQNNTETTKVSTFKKGTYIPPQNASLPLKNSIMKESDFIIIFFDPTNQQFLKLDSTQKLNSKFGPFSHTNFINQKYGTKIYSDSKTGYVFAFRSDRTFFTANQRHRTQILYSPDISLSIFYLNINSDSIIVESGTGSGSMSYSISKALGKSGHLFTFEFNAERATEVEKDFERANRYNITTTRRDVYKDGFLVDDKLGEQGADAVFIDLPSPWLAAEGVKQVLKKGGRCCNFSPCIEQVEKMIAALAGLGFGEFKTIECLERRYERRNIRKRSLKFLGMRNEERKRIALGDEEGGKKKLKVDGDDSGKVIGNSKEDSDYYLSWAMGSERLGRWHTGYLTYCTKFL